MMNETACFECGTPFLPGRRTQRFCSKPCKVRWHARDWRHRNPERAREIDHKSHAPKRAERVASVKQWRDDNRELVREMDKARWNGERQELNNAVRASRGRQDRIDRPWKRSMDVAKHRTTARGLPPFGLTDEWAIARWTGRCELTNIPFVLAKNHAGFFSPSLDRIEPSKGYVPSNCRFILWCVNAFKGQGNDEDMMFVARSMVENAAKSST